MLSRLLLAMLLATLVLGAGPSSTAAQAGPWSVTALSAGRAHTVPATVGTKTLFAAGCKLGCEHPRSWQPSDVVDVYDSTTGQWTASKLSEARSKPDAVTVGDKVLYAGGEGEGTRPSATVDVFDSTTGIWSTATLSQARFGPTVALAGTQALVVAGQTLDVFDAVTGQWSVTQRTGTSNSPTVARLGSQAVFLEGSKIDLYDATSGQWSTAALSQSRSQVTVGIVGSRVLFAGGAHSDSTVPGGIRYSTVVEVYDSAPNE